jgi:prolipoprotein diacylglyceryltransferase
MEQLFNVLFLGLFFTFLISRLFYVILHVNKSYFNPLVFLLVPYFPGLSLFGMIAGMFFTFTYLTKRRKINSGRFLDYSALATLAAFPIGLLGMSLLDQKKEILGWIYMPVLYIVLFTFYVKVLFPKFSRGTLKEGSLSMLFLILFSLVSLLHDVILLYTSNILLKTEDFLYMALFWEHP